MVLTRRLGSSFVLVVAMALPGLAPAQTGDLAAPGSAGHYREILTEGLRSDRIDFVALREAYARDPSYDGSSRLWEMFAERMMADQMGTLPPEWTNDEVTAAIIEDFPLLETHYAAFMYYRSLSDPAAVGLVDGAAGMFQDLMKVVLATERPGPEGPIYTVLSVSEEYMVLQALGREHTAQALVEIDGRPHDRMDTAEGPVFFDISAFFGR